MNVTHVNTDALNAVLTVSIEQNDYEPKVVQALKDARKKAVIKGFRPGNAPATLINRMYRKSATLDEVNKLVSEGISNYITEQKLNILGEPLPSEKQEPIDWDVQTSFDLHFDLAFSPEFELKLSKRDKVPYYSIKVDDKMRQGYIESIASRYGSYQSEEQADEKSLLKATLTELNADESPREDGITIENGMVSVMLVADESEKTKLIGSKVGDVMVIDITKAFPNETDRAALLKIGKDKLAGLQPNFQATITEVQKYANAEVNQELYDKLFGEGTVTTQEEFYAKLDQDIKLNLVGDSERKFSVDVREKLIEKFKIELPKDFLIRWLAAINEGKFTVEQIEKDYPHFENDLKWQLIRDRIASEQEFKVEQEELVSMARGFILNQMMQYGMGSLPEQFIEKYANDILEKKEERRKMAEGIIEKKVVTWIKDAIKLDEKEVDFEEFKELVSK
jgi:trigger factor